MPDINPIQGPIGPKEDPQKRDQKIGTPEKFKEQYRIQAVDGTDTEAEAKKKKKKSLGADDDDGDGLEGIATPTNTPNKSLAASPFEIQPPEKKVSGPSSTNADQSAASYDKSYTPSGSFTTLGDEGDAEDPFADNLPNAPTPAPSTQNTSTPNPQSSTSSQTAQPLDEGMTFSESDFTTQQQTPVITSDQNYPAQPSTTAPSSQTPSSSTSTSPSSTTPSEVTPVPAVGKTEASKDAKTGSKAPGLSSIEKGKGTPGPSPASIPPSDKQAPPLQPPSPQKIEEKFAQTPPPAAGQVVAPPPPPKNKELTPEEEGLAWDDELPPVSALTSESTGQGKKEGDDKDKEESAAQVISSTPDVPTPFSIDASPAPQGALPTYTTFSPAVLDMFEKMVGTISVLQESSGERKTTITLTSPNFASSAFYGAEIVIEEDLHLAPGQYNIRLVGSPEAVSLFQAKSDDLLAAFQSGNYNFKVQRLETSIQSTEKPLFKRKEGIGGDSGDGKGNTP